jgi:hypothetical protein
MRGGGAARKTWMPVTVPESSPGKGMTAER